METKPLTNKPSQQGLDFIKGYEKLRLNAYQDCGGVYTIGWGIIRYKNGAPVQKGDVITLQKAIDEFNYQVERKNGQLTLLVKGIDLTQNQYDALLSFVFNLGSGALATSTLLKKMKTNPDDATIYSYTKGVNTIAKADSCEFLKWVRVKGVVTKGLVNRRAAEADMYKNK